MSDLKGKLRYNSKKPYCPFNETHKVLDKNIKVQVGSDACQKCKSYKGGNKSWTNCDALRKARSVAARKEK